MKKLVFLTLFALCSLFVKAQHYEILYMEDLMFNGIYATYFCAQDNENLGVIIYGFNCPDNTWLVQDISGTILEDVIADSVIIYNTHEYNDIYVRAISCFDENEWYSFEFSTEIVFGDAALSPFDASILWKRPDEVLTLSALSSLHPIWSTGQTTSSIEVSEPGTYSVTLTNACGPVTYSVEVRDNVEIYRATTDLVSNLNQVTWNTTPEQSEYITAVKVYRNNELVGTVPYTDGVFTDNMGSENTQWQYHIVGVSVEGDDCPIPSYWKRTIHLDHVQGTQGDHILQWTPYAEESPEKSEVTAYRIFDVVDGVPTQVIDVGSFTNVYTYNPADFHGYGVVAAVFADDKGLEELAFSNVTSEMLNVGENLASKMRVYPNPANGVLFVETLCATSVPAETEYRIMNPIGQTLMRGEITSEKQQIDLRDLPNGVYFITVDGVTRKFVVE